MNIIEAIKSGKRFKRKDWKGYYNAQKANFYFVIDEVMADDWEVEKQITISETDLYEAWEKATKAEDLSSTQEDYLTKKIATYASATPEAFELLKKELGF